MCGPTDLPQPVGMFILENRSLLEEEGEFLDIRELRLCTSDSVCLCDHYFYLP
jgi:hypothetical protein